jgi:hypothetical protein
MRNALIACLAIVILFVGLIPAPLRAAALDDEPLVPVDEAHVYVKIDGDPILGRDVLDMKVEEIWDKELEGFVQHALILEELSVNKMDVTDADADAELKYILEKYAKQLGLNPDDVTPENLVRKFGLQLTVLRRQTRESLAMLRLFQQEKIIAAGVHTDDKNYRDALQQLLEKRVSEKGVIRDPKELGGGEAVRIGGRGYGRKEVRDFLVEALGQLPKSEFKQKLEVLKLEKIVQHALTARKIELNDDDLEFHFSYLCRKREMEPPYAPGRMVMRQALAAQGMTPEQFIHNRVTKSDAGVTRLARAKIGGQQLKAEFNSHPERYKRTENLIAHIMIRVLDPEGRPYTSAWKVPGHDALNIFIGKRREEQFTAARPRIEALIAQAKADFAGTAKTSSDDSKSAVVGGVIGRVGAETVLMPPCDVAVRDAAAKLKPGQISDPVRSDYGWHLLKCLDQQQVTFDEAEEHVYVNLLHDEREVLLKKLIDDAKKEEQE